MSIEIRRGEDRGHFDFGWLKTYHSFSFGDYHDPNNVQFGPLRVLNEDFIKAGQGFGAHSHRDMEIVTYVLGGAVAHKDSTGGTGTIKAGEVQRMSAGTGVQHSEFNASDREPVHLLQVWFMPERPSIKPGYQQEEAPGDGTNKFVDVATPTGGDGALKIHQDVVFKILNLEKGRSAVASIRQGRLGYLHNSMVGTIELNGTRLAPGDGAKIRGPEQLTVSALETARVVLFDMADIPAPPPRW
jgi:redox-sensitive bicupin YhaK (pirin superfamily)